MHASHVSLSVILQRCLDAMGGGVRAGRDAGFRVFTAVRLTLRRGHNMHRSWNKVCWRFVICCFVNVVARNVSLLKVAIVSSFATTQTFAITLKYRLVAYLVISIQTYCSRYAVRRPTQHPVFESHRVEAFRQVLSAPESPNQLPLLGELMLQSHMSYGRCKLGSPGTDRCIWCMVCVCVAQVRACVCDQKNNGNIAMSFP